MRVLIAVTLAASLFATNLLAADANMPLAPGQAAGVKKAQGLDETTWLLLAGGALAVIIAVAASNSGSTPPVQPTPTTSGPDAVKHPLAKRAA